MNQQKANTPSQNPLLQRPLQASAPGYREPFSHWGFQGNWGWEPGTHSLFPDLAGEGSPVDSVDSAAASAQITALVYG